ncbi:hypothetical protein PLICRDRAFT_26411 [Plicaturopsis crispa FD-325 SS-3]|nr:hypothetical protein PLICRDRAFT_26411 [Plicaturopsis crispa FD-325 SS-3]
MAAPSNLELPAALRLSSEELSTRIRSPEEDRQLLQGQTDTLQSILRRPVLLLPVEVLEIVFTYALPPASFLDPSLRAGGQNSSWCMTLRTKKALVLVCKLWRDVATKILYEEVVFRRPAQIPAFINTLNSSVLDLGFCVRRLGFLCVVTEESIASVVSGVTEVLDRCKRIEGLTWNPFDLDNIADRSPSTPSSARSEIEVPISICAIICPVGLTHLECGETIDYANLCSGLHSVRHTLRSLTFVLSAGYQPDEEQGIQQDVDLEQLENVRVTYAPSGDWYCWDILPPSWTTPRLKRLTVNNTAHFSDDVLPWFWTKLSDFCRLIFGRLEYLRVTLLTSGSYDPHNIQPVLDACPLLKHLVITMDYHMPISHPTLEYVDVEVPLADPDDMEAYETIYSALHDEELLPSVKDIRVLDKALRSLPDLPYIIRPLEPPLDENEDNECKFEWKFPGVHICYRDERLYRADMACFDGLDGAFDGLYDRAYRPIKHKTLTEWDEDSPWVDGGSSSDDEDDTESGEEDGPASGDE